MRLYIEVKRKPDERNKCTPRRKEILMYMSIKKEKKNEIEVIHRSTNFERERFLISSGDVDEQPEAEFVR